MKISNNNGKIKHVFLDFDGVLTDNRVYVNENGIESVRCSRLDGIGLNMLSQLGISVCIVSSETNCVVASRAKKLNVECYQGVENKEKFIKEYAESKLLKLRDCVFVGNDINDINALESVGYPIVVADAHQDVKKDEFYITKFKGGEGAVREVCDEIYKIMK